jgi:hypothetical protein
VPQILVTADNPRTDGERAVMFTERVSVSDFESGHFQAQLVERLGWAVGDADALEQDRNTDAREQERSERPEWTEPPQLESAEDVEPEQLRPAAEQQRLERASTPRLPAHSTR